MLQDCGIYRREEVRGWAVSEHITDGKPCWCKPRAIRDGDSIVWVHNDIPKSLLEGQELLEWVMKLDADALESLGQSALTELARVQRISENRLIEWDKEIERVKTLEAALKESEAQTKHWCGLRLEALQRAEKAEKIIQGEMMDPNGSIWEAHSAALRRAEAVEAKLKESEAERVRLKAGWQQEHREKNTTFQQSCDNLARAVASEAREKVLQERLKKYER